MTDSGPYLAARCRVVRSTYCVVHGFRSAAAFLLPRPCVSIAAEAEGEVSDASDSDGEAMRVLGTGSCGHVAAHRVCSAGF